MLGVAGILYAIYIILAMAVRDSVPPFWLVTCTIEVLLSYIVVIIREIEKDKSKK